MLVKSFFAGFGGQGVLLMGYALAYSAMKAERHVTYLPAYGAEIRGGTANCTVVIADEEIASPIASAPELVVVMNTPSLIKFQNYVASGGQLLLNSSLIAQRPGRSDVHVHPIPANELAEELGNARVANMVMLGAFVRLSGLVSLQALSEHLLSVFGERKRDLVPLNQRAVQVGYDYREAV